MSSSNGPKDGDKKPPKVGRVRHDASGRAIWEWAAETGKHAIDSTSRLLKRLDLPGLSSPRTQGREERRKAGHLLAARKKTDPLKGKRQSFNPYESQLAAEDPGASADGKTCAQTTRKTRGARQPAERARSH